MLPDTARWLLRTPARLIVAVALVAALLMLVPRLLTAGPDAQPTDQTTTTQRTPPVPARPHPYRLAPPSDRATHAHQPETPREVVRDEDRRDAVAAGRRFLVAWQTRVRRDRWLDGLKPHSTPELFRGLALTDPARVPTAPVQALRPIALGPYAAHLIARLADGQRLELSVVQVGGRWVVAAIESTPQR